MTRTSPVLSVGLLATFLFPQLDATVFGAAFVAAVVGDRLAHTVAVRGEAVGGDAL